MAHQPFPRKQSAPAVARTLGKQTSPAFPNQAPKPPATDRATQIAFYLMMGALAAALLYVMSLPFII